MADFGLYKEGPRHRYKCKRCIADAVTRRHRKIRAILLAEAGGACVVCGYARCSSNLHFHHVDPEQKSFNMTMARGKSETAYRAEARKCVLVCANCHGEIEAGVIESPPAIG
jgi:formate-dependent nitrite reductase cytochrome c552 subunit